jgi:murein DD-endopeptidase MepM/ murein hydrolase activator NlpD
LRFFPVQERAAQIIRVVILLFICAAALHAGETAYTVRGGETLFSISKKTAVPVDILKAYNKIDDPNKLKVGAVIKLPVAHTVAKGDTLYSIARSFSVTLAKLLELNGRSETSRIMPGDRVFLPAGAASAAGVATAAPKTSATTGAAAGTGQSKTTGTAIPPGTAGTGLAPGLAWPHSGRREQFKGKFSGLVFFGTRGDRVLSATDGEVKSVMPYWGWGKTVIIKSPDGTFFLYAGNEEILVNVGDRVGPGTEIARLGVSPQGGGAKLYFCIQGTKGQYIDPEKYFSRNHA